MKKLFILSTGRCGTTFLCHFFNSVIEDTLARGEIKPAFKRRGYELINRNTNWYEKMYFKLSRDYQMFSSSAKWFIETNNRLFSTSNKLIREVYPEAKVFHLIRDGRDVVQSWLNRGRYFPEEPASRLTPEIVPDDPYQNKWNEMNALEKCSWNWKTNNQIIKESKPDDTFYFEGIFSPPHKELYRLLEKLTGVKYSSKEVEEALKRKINPTKKKLFPAYPKWPESWKEKFWNIASECMDDFGYSDHKYGDYEV